MKGGEKGKKKSEVQLLHVFCFGLKMYFSCYTLKHYDMNDEICEVQELEPDILDTKYSLLMTLGSGHDWGVKLSLLFPYRTSG